jgi:hypothetical protein
MLSIWLYACYFGAIILTICMLTMLLSSCSEVISPNPDIPSGDKVGVKFSLADVTYNGHEVLTRKGSMGSPSWDDMEESVWIPFEDGLYINATMEVNQPVTTRSTHTNLDPGTTLRMTVYESDGETEHVHEDYSVSNTQELTGAGLDVDPGDYVFAAYSFNESATLPAHLDTISNIDPIHDLLWGKTSQHISEDDGNVLVKMSHRFSLVNLEISAQNLTGYTIGAISDIKVHGKKVDFTTNNGTITGTEVYDQLFQNSFSGINTATVTTNIPRTVYTGSTQTSVEIGSLTLNGPSGSKSFSNVTAVFDKQLQPGISYTLKIHFQKAPDNPDIDDDGAIPADFLVYVGAFWKAAQTGERLIRIERPSNAIDGAWTATVISGNDWIVLDKEMTKDTGVQAIFNKTGSDSPNNLGNDPGFDDLYPVNSTLTTVTGVLSATTPQIYFRIGLKSKYTPTTAKPARYGVILLSVKDNTQKFRIWVRQGENPDYVFSNNDNIFYDDATYYWGTKRSGNLPRLVTKRFTTYNLTAQTLDAIVNKKGTNSHNNPSKFTDYPSQAGAHFNYASPEAPDPLNRIRWAISPHIINLPPCPQAGCYAPRVPATNVFWNTLAPDHETCPEGYRRPNDGSTTSYVRTLYSGYDYTTHSDSEIRQSLYRAPLEDFVNTNDGSNSVFGFYADGLFDRRRKTTVDGATGGTVRQLHSVAANTRDIAHYGLLFYNPLTSSDHYGASIFFPSGGWRDSRNDGTVGSLYTKDDDGGYMTSSQTQYTVAAVTTNYAVFMREVINKSGLWRVDARDGMMIRCVVDE